MKHLPNLLTLANLFCGCIAIAYILSAQPYTSMSLADRSGLPTWQWVFGAQQMYMGSFFIGIAALCDALDGLAARALDVFSPIGKDLDSLADLVSFGVAPACILYKFLWDALMSEQNAMDVNMLGMAPAFLLACFSALRLARFNISSGTQTKYFTGMPTPAIGLFVASFPLVMWFSPRSISRYFDMAIHGRWNMYVLIAILCWLMVSKMKFLKLMPGKMPIGQMWPQIVLVLFAAAGIFAIGYAAIPLTFVLYLLLSLVYKYPQTNDQ